MASEAKQTSITGLSTTVFNRRMWINELIGFNDTLAVFN